MKRYDNEFQETLREFRRRIAHRAVVWIDDGTGRILDELEVETRIRPGTEGCQLCHESLDGREAHGAIEFDERGLPRLLPGPGGAICIDCVEWVRWVRSISRARTRSRGSIGSSSYRDLGSRTRSAFRSRSASASRSCSSATGMAGSQGRTCSQPSRDSRSGREWSCGGRGRKS
jgi:hypothetical protein